MRILQMFHYNIKNIIPLLDKVKDRGFTHIQIAPIQPTKNNSINWEDYWVLYQPLGLRIGNAQVGSKDDLIKLCELAKDKGLKIIVDVIFRHTGTDEMDNTKPHKNVDSELSPFILNKPHMDENIREQCTDYSCGMPVLDVENKEFQKLAIKFLDELFECGIDMIRGDQFAKHYRLPFEGGTFISEVISKYPCYGEGIFYDKYWLDQYSKYMMIGSETCISDKNKLITWIESHDTNLCFGYTKKMNSEMLINEYRILCDNYPHTLFYCRPFDNLWQRDEIKYINNKLK